MRSPALKSLLICLLVLAAPAIDAAEQTSESIAEVKEAVESGKAVLVDVREKREWDTGHVQGAISLPLSRLQSAADAKDLIARLPKGKVLYTHCAVGKRALSAGNILEKYGYEVRCLKPGYKELTGAGFEKAAE